MLATLLVLSFLFYYFFYIKINKLFFLSVIINAMLFSELSATTGSIEEKFNFLLIMFFILSRLLTINKNSSILSFFPDKIDSYYTIFFFLYLFLQSVRSIIIFPRGFGSFFWPFYFLSLSLILFISSSRNTNNNNINNIQIIEISRHLLLALGLYLIFICGSYIMYSLGILDNNHYLPFRGSLLFTLTCFLPLVYIHSLYDQLYWRKVALYVGFLGALSAILISSRAALIPVLLINALILFSFKINIKFILSIILISFLLLILSFTNEILIEDTYQTIQDTIRIFSYGDKDLEEIEDLDRAIHYIATWELLSKDLLVLLFGVGFRLSGLYLADPLAEYYRKMLPHLDFIIELGSNTDVYTFGWNGLFLEVGLFGVTLLFILFIRNFKYIYYNSDGLFRLTLIFTLLIFFLRLFANSFSGYTLFYLLIIPSFLFRFFITARNAMLNNFPMNRSLI